MKVPLIQFSLQNAFLTDFEIVSLDSICRRSTQLEHDSESPHRVEFHMLLYIQEGHGAHCIDFNRYSFSSGSFIFINLNQIHAFDFSHNPSGYAMMFTQEFKDSIRSNIRLPSFLSDYTSFNEAPVVTPQGELKASAEVLLHEIGKINGTHKHDATLVQLLFSALMLKLHSQIPSTLSKNITERQTAKFLQFLSLISENYTTYKNASKYADLMGMTYKSLNQLCHATVDQTPKQLINTHIILEAKRRLAINHIPVKQLAFELGFDEVSNFIKYFKKQTLVTPQQFKKNQKG